VNELEVRDILQNHGALLSGHFKLTSGLHSDTYVQKQRVLEYPRVTRTLAAALAARFPDGADVVLSPALGALPLGFALASELDARFIFAERVDGAMALRRGQAIERGERVIVCEDVITTGGSAAECIDLAKASGATVLGVASLVDRSPVAPGFRLESLLRVEADAWEPGQCPMCARDEPIDEPGSRALSR